MCSVACIHVHACVYGWYVCECEICILYVAYHFFTDALKEMITFYVPLYTTESQILTCLQLNGSQNFPTSTYSH